MRSTSRFNRPLLAGGLLFGVVALSTAQGCSVVANATAIQCTSEAECLGLGPAFADTTCDKETKTCKKVVATLECNTNQDCGIKTAGTICRKRDHKCVSLASPECSNILGKPEHLLDDTTIFIGAIVPHGSGELGDVQERAVELAQQEITPLATGSGIPFKSGNRPLVVVSCHEFNANGLQGVLNAANHLVMDLDVPVVVGPVAPGDQQLVATNVTLPAKVLTILAGGSYVSNLSTLNPAGSPPLIWRMNYSDADMMDTLQPFIDSELIPQLKAAGTLGASENVRIAIVSEGDYLGTNVSQLVREKITWNKKADGAPASCLDNLQLTPSACIPVSYGSLNDVIGNPSPEGKIASALGTVFTNSGTFAPPHIIINVYAAFGIPRVLFPLEAAWDTVTKGAPRPYQIGVAPPFNTFVPMFGFMDGWSATQAANGFVPFNKRMFGVYARGGVKPQDIDDFQFRLTQAFPEVTTQTPRDALVRIYYDGVYMAAYTLAALNDKPIPGPNLAASLPRLNLGEPVLAGPVDLGKGFAALARAEQGINLAGMSGHLDMDLTTGAPKYDVEISCPGQLPTGGATNFVSSGFYYDHAAAAVFGKGTVFNKATTQCPYLKN